MALYLHIWSLVPYYTILLYTILLYYTTLYYYTILHYTILLYTILCSTVLYSTMLFLLYYILYYTIQYYTLLYCTLCPYMCCCRSTGVCLQLNWWWSDANNPLDKCCYAKWTNVQYVCVLMSQPVLANMNPAGNYQETKAFCGDPIYGFQGLLWFILSDCLQIVRLQEVQGSGEWWGCVWGGYETLCPAVNQRVLCETEIARPLDLHMYVADGFKLALWGPGCDEEAHTCCQATCCSPIPQVTAWADTPGNPPGVTTNQTQNTSGPRCGPGLVQVWCGSDSLAK